MVEPRRAPFEKGSPTSREGSASKTPREGKDGQRREGLEQSTIVEPANSIAGGGIQS